MQCYPRGLSAARGFKLQAKEHSNEERPSDGRGSQTYHPRDFPGAINIPRGLLEFKLSSDPELENRDQKVVVYCKTSGRAALAARALKEMGYLHIFSIEGGFDAWQQAEKPVIKPTMPDFD
jgi:rhodanese-related sulfurtransferase